MGVIQRMSPVEILNLIENLREQLIYLAQNKALVDPEVVKLSQMLDAYLNLYHNALSGHIECRARYSDKAEYEVVARLKSGGLANL